jgi:uncharacterized surface anchored protein
VWNDVNGNGVQDGGEVGLPGVVVTVKDAANNVVGTATTSPTGAYTVGNLPAGTYTVCTSGAPAGYTPTYDLDGVATPNCTSVTVSADRTDVDFGYTPPRLTLGGIVWEDLDANGTKNGSEVGIGGVTVTVTDAANNTVGTPVTSSGGAYSVGNLLAGTYTVCVTAGVPAGDTETFDLTPPTTDGCATVTLSASRNDVDFGYTPPRYSIGDRVWDDGNANGVQDAGEGGIVGATVTVTNASNVVVGTTTTGANGAYTIGGLLAGTYKACVTGVPSGYNPSADLDGVATPNCATFTVTASRTDVDFGYYRLGSIGDFVWNDLNKNGIQDAGEPGLAGVTVKLTNGATTLTTTTDASGKYAFSGLAAGTYTVTVSGTPIGYVASPSNVGANDAVDSDGSGVSVVVAGAPNATVDFGFYEKIGAMACTYTQGFWKNHEDVWPAPFSPNAQWMTPQKQVIGMTWDGLFSVPPKGGNSYDQLAHQWMAAKLNRAQGAPTSSAVLQALNAAEAWLLANTPVSGPLPSIKNAQADAWGTTLDNFNNGLAGTSHCP